MTQRLAAVLAGQGGVFATRDALTAGIDHRELAALVRARAVVRVRRGAFVSGAVYEAAHPDERYRLRVRALLRARPESAAASHAALALHGLPHWSSDPRRIDLVAPVSRSHSSGGVVVRPLGECEIVLVDGWRSAGLAAALLQHAAGNGALAGVVAMDAAVHSTAIGLDRLSAPAEQIQGRGARDARRAVAMVDPACESVGETRTRILLRDLGIPCRSQVVVYDARAVLARVDFLAYDRVVIEFDGLCKYDGFAGREALAREKARESRLHDLGYEVVRLIWADLDNPPEVLRRVQVAAARARARS